MARPQVAVAAAVLAAVAAASAFLSSDISPPSPPLCAPFASLSFASLLFLTDGALTFTGELYRRRSRRLATRVRELEASLAAATEKAAAERRGRVRAQQVAIHLPVLGLQFCTFPPF